MKFVDTKFPIEQKNSKYFEETLSMRVRDYKERYQFGADLAQIFSYPLQLVSILAGSYLLWELGVTVFGLHHSETTSIALYILCFALFSFIETIRRWLVNTTGYHYYASYNPEYRQGEWLRNSLLTVSFISLLLVASGTWGAYQYSRNNAPQKSTLDIKQETSPLLTGLQEQKNAIAKLDQSIEMLQKNKAQELRDHKSYAVWQGKEYLLPETKTRHEGYDRQIAAMQTQRQKHLSLLEAQQAKLDKKEERTEKNNETILQQNHETKKVYGFIIAPMWFFFEVLLLFLLAYQWIHKTGAKRYAYSARIEQENAKPTKLSHPIHETHAKPAIQKHETEVEKPKVSQKKDLSVFRKKAKKLGFVINEKNKGGRIKKLSPDQENEAKAELKKGVSVRKLSEKYGVSKSTIQDLKSG